MSTPTVQCTSKLPTAHEPPAYEPTVAPAPAPVNGVRDIGAVEGGAAGSDAADPA